MIRNAFYRPVWFSDATLRVVIFELPLHYQIRTELSDEELLRTVRVRRCSIQGTDRVDVAVGPKPTVVVVLNHDRVRTIVLINRRSDIPAEAVYAQVRAIRREMHQV